MCYRSNISLHRTEGLLSNFMMKYESDNCKLLLKMGMVSNKMFDPFVSVGRTNSGNMVHFVNKIKARA